MKIITVTANPALDITACAYQWQRAEVNLGQSIITHVGGKGINVAINLANSGLAVYATGWLGAGNDALFSKTFQRHNIHDAFIRVEGETRHNIKIVDTLKSDNTDFNMPGLTVDACAQVELEHYLAEVVDPETILVLGGSLPPSLATDFYVKMVNQFRDNCHFMAVDTSGKPLTELLQSDNLPHLIKPNIHELRSATGKVLASDESLIAEAKTLLKRGIRLVIISMGEQGAWFINQERAIKALPLKVEIATTVGAGDAMVAGAIQAITQNLGLEAIATIATAYSAANIEHIGAKLPSKARLERLQSQVILEDFIGYKKPS